MDYFDLFIAVFATVILFLYGLHSFSREVQLLGKERLNEVLGRLTRNRFSGFLLGAFFTAIVQSSSAVTSLAIVLVDAGVISFANSLAVLIGANVGTTVTAWLVSFKLTGIGPIFIILGALFTVIPGPLRVAGKSVFYFGLIFFALDLISESLDPIKKDPLLMEWLAATSSPLIGAVIGAILTALVQSSSVVTGLSILLVQQGAIDVTGAIAIIIGANAGTTVTGLIASIAMKPSAKRTAVINLLINFSGVLLFLPFAPQLAAYVQELTEDFGIAVAIAHLIFNVGIAVLSLPFVRVIAKWTEPSTR